jgi:ketosteroid isomerase-like protein
MADSEIAAKLRAGYMSFNEGDFDTLLPTIAEDFELHRRLGGLDDGTVVHGRDAFRLYLEPDVFSKMHSEILELREGPGKILIEARTTAVGAASGLEMTQTSWQVWEHDGDRAHRVTLFADRAAAEKAAGLSG